MNGHRAAVGLCALCALLISAFAAQSASAVTNGTTAFTCKNTGAGSFTKAHCKNADAGPGNYSHVAVAQDTTTEVEITSQSTNADTTSCTVFEKKSTIGGISAALTSCDIHGTGWMENKLEGNEHYTVSHVTLTTTGVIADLPGCKVWTDIAPGQKGEEGVIHTEPLKITTKGQGDSVKIEPTTGTIIARFFLTSCNTAALNGTYEISGSFSCKRDGATINCSHAEVTTQNTLKWNTVTKAGANGSLTVKSRFNPTESYTPLSVTTVAT